MSTIVEPSPEAPTTPKQAETEAEDTRELDGRRDAAEAPVSKKDPEESQVPKPKKKKKKQRTTSLASDANPVPSEADSKGSDPWQQQNEVAPPMPPTSDNRALTGGELLRGGLVLAGAAALGFLAVRFLRKVVRGSRKSSSQPAAPSLPSPLSRLLSERKAALEAQAARSFGAVVKPLSLPPLGEGALSGLTLGIKDNIDVEGEVTGNGNPDWAATHPPAAAHSPAVKAMLEAGAAGSLKLVMDELAYSLQGTNRHFGTPCNPASPERIPGGSSSGSAVAVAGGLCDVALGSDTAGSIRVPAACCGIVGLRTTHGAVPNSGLCPLAPSLDSVGLFTRDLPTMAKAARALLPALPSPQEPAAPTKVLVALDLFLRCETEQLQLAIPALEMALKQLYRDAVVGVSFCGFIVGALDDLPEFVTVRNEEGKADPLDALRQACAFLQQHEVYTCLGDFYRKHGQGLDTAIQRRIEAAGKVTEDQFQRAVALRERYRTAVAASLNDRTVLVVPSLPAYAPKLTASAEETDTWRTRVMELTSIAGFGGFPQLTFPIGTSDDDATCPVSVSLVGGHNSDLLLVGLAQVIQPAVQGAYRSAQETFRQQLEEEAEGGDEGVNGHVHVPAAAPVPTPASSSAHQTSAAGKPSGSAADRPSSSSAAASGKEAEVERLKNQGNDHYKRGHYQDAVRSYSAAITLDDKNAILYSNRAMAHIKMLNYDFAVLDCDAALRLDPRSVKALLRRATASSALGRHREAKQDLELVLHLEPGNAQAKADLKGVNTMLRELGL